MPVLELYDPRRRERIVYTKSGLNWGFANAHVNLGDAYITLRKAFLRENEDFFPPHGSVISVVWDDGTHMQCRLEGTQDLDGRKAPKQISSDGDKSILGIYLRERLGVGCDHLVAYSDLEKYGRDNIEVTKDGDAFYFDFSVNR